MKYLNLVSTVLFVSLLLQGTLGFARSGPQGITLEGNILTATNLPEEAASVSFTIQVKSPGVESCVLYQESQTLNMTNSGGVFSLSIGSGARGSSGYESTSTVKSAFNNSSAALTGLTCASGSSYTPASNDKRLVMLTFDDGSGAQSITQALDVQSVPFAMYADTLQGKTPTDLIQVNTTTKAVSQANIESVFDSNADVTALVALINGTSSLYAQPGGSNAFTGAVSFTTAPTTSAAPTTSTSIVNKTYADGSIAGKAIDSTTLSSLTAGTLPAGDVLAWNGTNWAASPSSDSSKLPLAGGTMTGAIAMGGNDITNTGYLTIAGSHYLGLGTYSDAAEVTLTGTLNSTYKGVTWYNITSDQVKYWNGTSVVALGAAGSGMTALTGDVTASGSGSAAATVNKVNGVTYSASPVTNTVPVVTASNTVTYEAVPNAALANSSVTIGTTAVSLGATATSLNGLTSLGLGVNGTTNGSLNVASGASGGASVTLQNPSTVSAYNFNLPTTAGTAGYALTSGGGGTSPMTWTAIPSASGSSSVTTVGTVTSGTWNGTTVTIPYGGTGATTAAAARTNLSAAASGTNGDITSTTSLTSLSSSIGTITLAPTGALNLNPTTSVISSMPYLSPLGSVTIPAYGNSTTTNTGLYFPTATSLALSTNGAAAMTVDSSGNIGIGTTSPLYPLDVNGSGQFRGDLWIQEFSPNAYSPTAHPWLPGALLTNTDPIDATGTMLTFSQRNTATTIQNAWLGTIANPTGYAPTLFFQQQTGASTYAERMRIDANGNVGIGTASPRAKLEIFNTAASSSSGQEVLRLSSDANGNIPGAGPYIRFDNGANAEIGRINAVAESTSNVGMSIWTYGGGGINERVRISANGNVGLGITAPTALLNLKAGGTTAGSAPLKFTSAGTKLVTVEDGAMEYDGTNYYLTVGSSRNSIPLAGGNANYSTTSTSSGSASSPSYTFNGDATSGFYDVTPGTIGVAISGAQTANFSSTGLTIPVTSTSSSATTGALVVGGGVGVGGALNVGTSIKSLGGVLTSTSASSSLYSSTSSSIATPVGPNVLVSNTSATDSTGAFENFSVINSSSKSQSAYMGAVATTGSGYVPSIVIGQQTGSGAYAERMRIDPNGNIGIGTTTPQAVLDITKTATMTSGFTNYISSVAATYNPPTSPGAGTSLTAQSNAIYTAGSSSLNNVQLYGNSSGIIHLTNVPVQFATGSYSGVSNYGTGTMSQVNGGLSFLSNISSGAMTTANGYSAVIQNQGSGAITTAIGLSSSIGNSGSITDAYGVRAAVTNTGTITRGYGLYVDPIAGTTAYGIYQSSATNSNFFAGNVGIGTTNPLSTLSIGSGSLADSNIPMQMSTGSSGSETNFGINKNGAYGFLLGYKNNNGNLGSYANYTGGYMRQVATDPFAIVVNNTTLSTIWNSSGDVAIGGNISNSSLSGASMVVKAGGNVGVGTATPGYKLDVSGDVNIASANVLRFGGTQVCATAGCTATSDRRLKEDIQPLQSALDDVLKLQGVTYNWIDKDKYGHGPQVGLIAQDLEKVYPQVVITDPKTGLKSVAYDHLISPVIEAIKALYGRIVGIETHMNMHDREIASVRADNADLKIENAQLKQKNADMESRLERLEKMMNSK